MMDPRHAAVRKRWLEVFALSTVGALLVAAAQAIGFVPWFVRVILANDFASTSVAVAASTWFVFANRGRLLAALGVRHFFRYPPPWLAAVLGFGVWLALWTAVAWMAPAHLPVDQRDWSAAVVHALFGARTIAPAFLFFSVATPLCLGFVSVGAAYVSALTTEPEGVPAKDSKASFSPIDFLAFGRSASSGGEWLAEGERLIEWATRESPLESDGDDVAHRQAIAARLTAAIGRERGRGHRRPNVLLLGEVGSGKSSIAALLDKRDLRTSGVEFRRVSLWAFHDEESAARHVLDALVGALREHVSTLAVEGVPAAYIEAIKLTLNAGTWGRLLDFMRGGQDSPAELVFKLRTVARAIGVHVHLWIEDLERFSASEGPRLASFAKGPLFGLLHAIGNDEASAQATAGEFSFTVATTPDAVPSADRGKLFGHVEVLTAFDASLVWEILDRVRGAQRERRERADRAPSAEPLDECFTEPDNLYDYPRVTWQRAASRQQGLQHELFVALAALLRTPREVKACIRGATEHMRQLEGDGSFDELLVLHAIRGRDFAAYAWLARKGDHLFALVDAQRFSSNPRLAADDYPPTVDAAAGRAGVALFNHAAAHSGDPLVRSIAHPRYWERVFGEPNLATAIADDDLWRRAVVSEPADGVAVVAAAKAMPRWFSSAAFSPAHTFKAVGALIERGAYGVDVDDLGAAATALGAELLRRRKAITDQHAGGEVVRHSAARTDVHAWSGAVVVLHAFARAAGVEEERVFAESLRDGVDALAQVAVASLSAGDPRDLAMAARYAGERTFVLAKLIELGKWTGRNDDDVFARMRPVVAAVQQALERLVIDSEIAEDPRDTQTLGIWLIPLETAEGELEQRLLGTTQGHTG